MKKKKEISTQELLGVKSFSRNGIQTNGHGEIVYFSVSPTNISVLSRSSISQKINHLMQLLCEQPDIEILCTDGTENFDNNKLYLEKRIQSEQNLRVRSLLEQDKKFLDDIQLEMSTAREFMFLIRLRNESNEQSFANLNRIEKLINDQGFDCKRAEKDDVKRVLSRYFGIVTAQSKIDDIDGESAVAKWIIPD